MRDRIHGVNTIATAHRAETDKLRDGSPQPRFPGRPSVPLAAAVQELEEPGQQLRGARLVGVHEEFLLHRQLRRHDDRLLGAVLADAARAVARAEARGLRAAHRQLERRVVDHRVVDVDRARFEAARDRLAALGVAA